MRFTVYQAPFEQTSGGYREDADYAATWEGEIEAARPATVEGGEIRLGAARPVLRPEEDATGLLEEIWTNFQRVDPETGPWPPEGYEGRSLSVGDVVLLDGWAAFSVDHVGFSAAPGFLQLALARAEA